MSQHTRAISTDAVLQVATHERRRRILQYLGEHDGDTVSTDDLAEWLRNTATESSGGSRLDREQLVIELHHVHLPKLDEVGVIEYDVETGTVRPRLQPRVETFVEFVRTEL